MFKLITIFLLASSTAFSQTNHSGTYSYSHKVEGNPPKGEENNGPAGNLALLKMEGNKYRFWLDVTIGWPSYNIGLADGIVTIKNDTGTYHYSFEENDNYPCIFRFKKKGNVFNIDSRSSSFVCGFGEGVSADGDYTREKKQPVMNNNWLKEKYSQSSFMIVSGTKATVYQDENALRPYTQSLSFAKGTRLPNIDERQNTVYTEFINPAGKFIYGWVKKKDVKLLDFGE